MKKNVRMILILFCITCVLRGCGLLPFSDDNPFAKQGGNKGEKEVAKIEEDPQSQSEESQEQEDKRRHLAV